jgi:hypothetical protein
VFFVYISIDSLSARCIHDHTESDVNEESFEQRDKPEQRRDEAADDNDRSFSVFDRLDVTARRRTNSRGAIVNADDDGVRRLARVALGYPALSLVRLSGLFSTCTRVRARATHTLKILDSGGGARE